MKKITRLAAVAVTGLMLTSGMVSAASATESSAPAKACKTTVRKAKVAQKVTVTSLATAITNYNAALATYAANNYSVATDQKAALDAYKVVARARMAVKLAINYTFNCAVRDAAKARKTAVAQATTDAAKATAEATFKSAIAAAKKAKDDALKALAPMPVAPAGLKHGKPAKPAKP